MAPEARAAVFALRLLGHGKPRLAFSVAGVSFAVVLMLVQMGFRNSLLDSAVHLLAPSPRVRVIAALILLVAVGAMLAALVGG